MESKKIAEEICKALSSKKGEDIILIDVRGKTDLSDYFVLASGRSSTQVKALCDNVEEQLEKLGINPRRSEGVTEGRWAAVDYGDVILHVFNDEMRLFYHLERLWGDSGNIKKYED